jgi:hypothetical protein
MEINNEIQGSLARQYAVPDDLDEEVTGMHYTDNHTRLIVTIKMWSEEKETLLKGGLRC